MGTTHEITNTEDIIDSREVIERIADLEATEGALGELDDEFDELRALRKLADEGGSLADWYYGETLIRDSYFVDYARELAEDIGAVPADSQWPVYCIDWERAARELQVDYTSLEFDGVTYWARS